MLQRSLLCALKLVVFYAVLLGLTIVAPPLGALIGKAKWTMTLMPGLATGLLTRQLATRDRLIATSVFALLLACGWTLFSVAGKGLDAQRVALLFVASLPVMAVAGLWAFLGLLAGHKLQRKTRTPANAAAAEP